MAQPWPVLSGSSEPTQENNILNFADIFREYERPIYRYLLRLTQNQAEAEDLTQETFIRVERSLATFRGEASLSTWLYRIATNASFDHFRRQSTRQARNTLPLEETVPPGDWAIEALPSPDQQVNQAEMSACVQRFIQQLSPSYRAVLILHDLEGLKNETIADILGCSLSTVKIRLHRARNKLRASLAGGCDFAHDERNVFICEPRATDASQVTFLEE